tara:strand:+ start:87 stop:656 length:570 start_codon:yes stop_codon:yes gene_type:complete
MKASIYVIINDLNLPAYVGSTEKTLEERYRKHIVDSKSKRSSHRELYVNMREYGIEHFWIELWENIECQSNRELLRIEGLNKLEIEKFAELTNKLTPRGIGNNSTEQYKANPESYQRKLEKSREKYRANPEIYQARQREYRKANSESYQRTLAKAKQNITCDICGSNTDRGHIARHKKSKYCRSFAIEK